MSERTKDRLAADLDAAGAPAWMSALAREGGYDDYESATPMPIIRLVQDCQAAGLTALAQRAMQGDYDATLEEGNAWMQREGRHLLADEGESPHA